MRARYLEEENNALKGEVDHLKKENTDLKQMMVTLEEKLNQMAENRQENMAANLCESKRKKCKKTVEKLGVEPGWKTWRRTGVT